MSKRPEQYFNNDLRTTEPHLEVANRSSNRQKAIDIVNPFNDRGGPFNGGGRMGWA